MIFIASMYEKLQEDLLEVDTEEEKKLLIKVAEGKPSTL